MRNYTLRPVIVLFSMALFSGCDLINPEEDQPGYITIQKPVFSAGTFNFNSHEIASGWVYENGRLLGVFDLPVTVPLLSTGETRISVNAGIVSDGQRATRDMYPFYTFHDQKLTVTPGQSYTITPSFTYDNGVKAPLEQSFEISKAQFEARAPYSLERIQIAPGDSMFYDRGGDFFAAVFSKPDTADVIQIVSTEENIALRPGAPVYLEFDIRSNIPVSIGVLYTIDGTEYGPAYELTVFGTGEWKKFYANMVNEVAESINPNTRYKVVFLAKPGTSGRDYVAVDNVRLVHF